MGEDKIDETVKGGYVENTLDGLLKEISWYPESLYTLDVCESEGELYVLELGSFSCSGEYGCSISLIIEAGAKAALEDYEAVNDF